MNKITCICLGVKDMERSIKFYRDGLGYKTDCRENNPSVCFFDTPGTKFELFPLEQLAKDIVYYRGKIMGGIYDDRFLVKPVKSAIVLKETMQPVGSIGCFFGSFWWRDVSRI